MRVLVTGADGQVGREVAEICEDAGDQVTSCGRTALDVTDRDVVFQITSAIRPDVVIHAAAWTAVDDCESDRDRAFRVNALGTRHVAEAANRVGAHVVALSTDYVFDGTKTDPYLEWDPPNPRSVYGRSKLAGEQALAGYTGTAVVRTSWVCGRYGSNMVKTVLRLASAGGPLAFVDDQRGQPTIVGDLAPMLRRVAVDRRSGLFHITNQGATSWYEFAREVLVAAGHDPGRVRPIKTSELDPPRPAPRPANSVLDNMVLRLSDLPMLPHYRESLHQLVRQIL